MCYTVLEAGRAPGAAILHAGSAVGLRRSQRIEAATEKSLLGNRGPLGMNSLRASKLNSGRSL